MSREIDDLDYNSLRNKIIEVLGNGAGTYGYGQPIVSSSVLQGNIITADQWNNLRNDLQSIIVHQSGLLQSIVEVRKGDVIRETAGDPLLQFDRIIEEARISRFDVATSQSTISIVTTKTFSSAWNNLATMTATINFSTAEEGRYFFNSGGKIRFTSTRTGGDSTAQNNAWTNVLSSAGIVIFSANSENLNYYTLTNSYKILRQQFLSTPYSSNNYKIEALSNVGNNSAGTATSVTFKITWTDTYTDPYPPDSIVDRVNGTLSLSIEELKAAGNLQPSGSFTITSPSYTVSNITAS